MRIKTRIGEEILWVIDMRNLEIVVGALGAVICSLAISLINTEWKIEDQPSDNGMPLSDIPEEAAASIAQDITTTTEAASIEGGVDTANTGPNSTGQSHNASVCARTLLLLSKTKSLYTQFRALSL